MAKGSLAKQFVENKIQQVFGKDFIGIYDKKLYVWAEENGEKVQIAISLTCPKVQISVADAPPTGDLNFEDDTPPTVVASGFQPAEITSEERARANELLEMIKNF